MTREEEDEKIMQRWDEWRKYISNGGKASWPRDEFENLIAWYEERIKELEDERERLSKLLIEARMRIVELEEEKRWMVRLSKEDMKKLGWSSTY